MIELKSHKQVCAVTESPDFVRHVQLWNVYHCLWVCNIGVAVHAG